jgi:hypothetical protein
MLSIAARAGTSPIPTTALEGEDELLLRIMGSRHRVGMKGEMLVGMLALSVDRINSPLAGGGTRGSCIATTG